MDNTFVPSLFVQSMVAPTTIEMMEELLSKKRDKSCKWLLNESLSPADLYIYLKARFGPPNGFQMILRNKHSDNFIQWHYTLKSGISNLDILGLNTRTEFWISGFTNLSDDDCTKLVDEIKSDFKQFGPKMKEVRKNLESWSLFYNPYHRLKKIVMQYSEELSELNKYLELPQDPPVYPLINSPERKSLKEDLEEYANKMNELSNKYIRACELSASLRLICPVWAEAFINFLIFILARKEIKNDERLYQDFIRKDIDVRVKLLNINCQHFVAPIDSSDKIYKDFHSLMNERNDLLHGNINPKKLSYETVYFDGTIPLFTEVQGLAKNALGISLVGIEPIETLKKVDIVNSFINFILNHLEQEYREQISFILDKRDLGWREEAKRIGVLFSDNITEGYIR